MRSFLNFKLCLFVICFSGCASIPCYPPSHYVPEQGATYTAEDVKVPTTKGHLLAGTLTIPSSIDPPYPAVVLITGSSPQDRDMLHHWSKPYCLFKPFKQIADTLSSGGIAVLRMDDQGIGCSQGGPFDDITIQERAEDARAGLKYLRKRQEIDQNRLGILGASEGANIAAIIAASDPSIRAIVMMAGSATNGWKIKEYQYRYEIKREEKLTNEDIEHEVTIKMRSLRQAVREGKGSPWFNSFLEYMPLPTATKVACPVLILHGDKDAHVPFEHAHFLAQAMRSQGNDQVSVKILKDYNHPLLKDSDGRRSRYKELLKDTNQLSEELLVIIFDWFSTNL